MTDVPVSQEDREARVARYLSNEKAARESLATYPESTRQRLEAWQTKQCEWFSDTILEIVAEFITIDDATRQQAERDVIARMEPVGWQRRRKYPLASDPAGKIYQWEQCSTREATGHFEREAGYEYRPLYALPTPPAGEA